MQPFLCLYVIIEGIIELLATEQWVHIDVVFENSVYGYGLKTDFEDARIMHNGNNYTRTPICVEHYIDVTKQHWVSLDERCSVYQIIVACNGSSTFVNLFDTGTLYSESQSLVRVFRFIINIVFMLFSDYWVTRLGWL